MNTKMKSIEIDGASLSIEQVAAVAHDLTGLLPVKLSNKAKQKMKKSRQYIMNKVKKGEVIYGVNTGFGSLSQIRIDDNQLEQLQRNIIRSHSVGVGTPLTEQQTRAAILLRANTLAAGYSGVTIEVVEALLDLLNAGVHPVIPCQGSVGASGDLAPLSHLALTLIGEGEAFFEGKRMNSAVALRKAELKPYQLQPKEGLSLINGTQIMTAIGALILSEAKRYAELSDWTAACSVEALKGSIVPFDALISQVRPHPGQIAVAKRMRSILKGSAIMESHKDCGKVQDPYSIRCIPQVHGIANDTIEHCWKIVEQELNSVTDNPLVFADEDKILSGGNFHGEYVAVAMDQLAIALAELANISEQRISKLMNSTFSELPPFLAKNSGLNSGFMIVQVAAASLVSENKVLCHPASVDSIPTSADKEDHVSMGTIAARKCADIMKNCWHVLAMECLVALHGLEFHLPLKPSRALQTFIKGVRKVYPSIEEDRAFYVDIENIKTHLITRTTHELETLRKS